MSDGKNKKNCLLIAVSVLFYQLPGKNMNLFWHTHFRLNWFFKTVEIFNWFSFVDAKSLHNLYLQTQTYLIFYRITHFLLFFFSTLTYNKSNLLRNPTNRNILNSFSEHLLQFKWEDDIYFTENIKACWFN